MAFPDSTPVLPSPTTKRKRPSSLPQHLRPQPAAAAASPNRAKRGGATWARLDFILSIQARDLDIESKVEGCIALLQDSVSTLLSCLVTVNADLVSQKGYFAWELEDAIKCASFLRRIYEEIRQQKDVFGRFSYYFLSTYISIYSGCGPLKTSIKREVDEALRPGVYSLIDICTDDDLQLLHTMLGEGPCRSTLATLLNDYRLNFQYEGKV